MSVISIQSQVAWGHVGNSAAVFPLQMHGIDVIAVPTTLLSNRPGYPSLRGRVLDAPLVADLLRGIEERGAVEGAAMILSGYLGSPEIGAVVADFVARAKSRNPKLTYCCDPVLGDRDRGLFVAADIPPLVRDRLCPLADIITPNHFEFEFLCGAKATTSAQVIAAAQALMARGPSTVIVTSAELEDTPRGEIETLADRTIQRLARGHAKAADQPERHRRPVCRAIRSRARSGKGHARARSATPSRPSSPCWSAPPRAEPRKCASSRAARCSFIPRAGSSPLPSAVEGRPIAPTLMSSI